MSREVRKICSLCPLVFFTFIIWGYEKVYDVEMLSLISTMLSMLPEFLSFLGTQML